MTVKQTDTRAEIERTRDKLENILSPESESEDDTLADAVSDISSIEDETLVGANCRDNFANEVSDISSEDLNKEANNEAYLSDVSDVHATKEGDLVSKIISEVAQEIPSSEIDAAKSKQMEPLILKSSLSVNKKFGGGNSHLKDTSPFGFVDAMESNNLPPLDFQTPPSVEIISKHVEQLKSSEIDATKSKLTTRIPNHTRIFKNH